MNSHHLIRMMVNGELVHSKISKKNPDPINTAVRTKSIIYLRKFGKAIISDVQILVNGSWSRVMYKPFGKEYYKY